jgi:hypothetical protein
MRFLDDPEYRQYGLTASHLEDYNLVSVEMILA